MLRTPSPDADAILPRVEAADASAPRWLKLRLSILVFLGYAVMGAWVPVFTLHLKDLGFTPEQTAWASATSAIASLFAPLLWGQMADRWLAGERCIFCCGLATCGIMAYLSSLTEPGPIFACCIAAWFFLVPALGLMSSYVFRQLEHPERDFGQIRLWGTVGWIAANWCLSLWFAVQWWLAADPALFVIDWTNSLRLSAWAALLLACYALTLPHAPPKAPAGLLLRPALGLLRCIDAPLSTLRLFRQRSFSVYAGCYFAVYLTMPFTIQLNPLLLSRIGVDPERLPIYLTIAQSTEVVMLGLLPICLARLGTKPTMCLGNLAWTLGLIVLSIGAPAGLVLPALATHGFFIACFLVAGQVFVNRLATQAMRASAQGLLLVISGSAQLAGHLLVGVIRDLTQDHFRTAYLSAAAVSGLALVVFCVGFTPPSDTRISQDGPLVPDPELS